MAMTPEDLATLFIQEELTACGELDRITSDLERQMIRAFDTQRLEAPGSARNCTTCVYGYTSGRNCRKFRGCNTWVSGNPVAYLSIPDWIARAEPEPASVSAPAFDPDAYPFF